MLSLIALAVASATPQASPTLMPTAPWWEKITMTLDAEGTERSCNYESSVSPAEDGACDTETTAPTKAAVGVDAPAGVYTKLTFERRFNPGAQPDLGKLQPGDTLLGGQVIALSIDGTGAVKGCRVVVSSGEMMPTYGCKEAQDEKFEVRKHGASANATHEGFMTILVYGHMEQLA